MLNNHLQSPVTQQRLRAGLAAGHVDDFADWLHDQGYRPSSVTTILQALAAWSDWATQAGFAPSEAMDALDSCKALVARADRPRYARGPYKHSLSAGALFIRFLQGHGVLACPAPAPRPSERWPILGDFRVWTQQQGGLRESSLDSYQFYIVKMLECLGDAVDTYTAGKVRGFVEQCAKPHGLWRAKSITTATRAFLRFLSATGQCEVGLEHAIPSYASRQLSDVPRFLEPADVERVLAVCVAQDPKGLRDRAVMLLLARLGLRASEVAGLMLQDLDWRNGWIGLCGKGRRHERLPLPQEVGDAILRYLLEGRPALVDDHVFARVNAPRGPLTRAAVTHIARSALRRAGVKAPINGAHVFRHSVATTMLRRGASLAGVGAVLRHQSPSTTAHYAKIDFDLLTEVAQPWPEVPPC